MANQNSSDDTIFQWEASNFTEGFPFDYFGNATREVDDFEITITSFIGQSRKLLERKTDNSLDPRAVIDLAKLMRLGF